MTTDYFEEQIEMDLPEPVRRLKRSRLGAQISLFHSRKNRRIWSLESSIELDYAHLLEWSTDVLGFVPQPLEISYVQHGLRKLYVPDFLQVNRTMERVVTEIKPLGWDESPFLREKYALVGHELAIQGFRFCVVTDRDLRTGFLLQNLRYLYPFHLSLKDSDLRNVVIALKRVTGQITVRALLDSNPCLSYDALAGYAYENWVGIESALFDLSTVLKLEG
jgi:hypothetical protein